MKKIITAAFALVLGIAPLAHAAEAFDGCAKCGLVEKVELVTNAEQKITSMTLTVAMLDGQNSRTMTFASNAPLVAPGTLIEISNDGRSFRQLK